MSTWVSGGVGGKEAGWCDAPGSHPGTVAGQSAWWEWWGWPHWEHHGHKRWNTVLAENGTVVDTTHTTDAGLRPSMGKKKCDVWNESNAPGMHIDGVIADGWLPHAW